MKDKKIPSVREVIDDVILSIEDNRTRNSDPYSLSHSLKRVIAALEVGRALDEPIYVSRLEVARAQVARLEKRIEELEREVAQS